MAQRPENTFDLRPPPGLSDLERVQWLHDLAEAVEQAEHLEMVVCDHEAVNPARVTATSLDPCARKLIIVVNYRPCVNKLMDPVEIATDEVFERSSSPLETYPAAPGTG